MPTRCDLPRIDSRLSHGIPCLPPSLRCALPQVWHARAGPHESPQQAIDLPRARLPNCTRLGGESGHYTGNAVGVGVDDGVNVAVGGVVAVGVQVAVAVGIAA